MTPESVHEADPGLFDEFTVEIPGEGEVDVEVLETSADPNGPIEVGTADQTVDDRYLIWSNGEVESL